MSAPVNARDQYEHWAPTYDEDTARLGWVAPTELIAAATTHLAPASWQSVVDLGVGTGQASAPWRDAGARVVGVDISRAMLEQAARADDRFHALVEHDLDGGLPDTVLRHGDADLLLSCGALHFVRDAAALLVAAQAVLVPGGLIAFTYIPEQGRSFGAHTRVHASGEVRGWLEHAGLRELEHREFIAYHGDGGPVRYGLVVARDAREPRPWPTALRWIDRTACVDRSRLRALLERAPWSPTPESGADLRTRVVAGVTDPRALPWPAAAPASDRDRAGCTVLAVMPHPDDESLYVGGTLAAWARAGARVELVVATAGAGGRGGPGLASRRAAELLHAASLLGVHALSCLGWTDGGKYHDPARTRPLTADDAIASWGLARALHDVVREIRARRPLRVLSLDPEVDPNLSLHGHHLALGRLVAIAFELAADPTFAPELGAAWAAHEHVVITSRIDAPAASRHTTDPAIKRAAIAAHGSQSYSTARSIAATDDALDEWCRTVQRRAPVRLPRIRVRGRGGPDATPTWSETRDRVLVRPRPRAALAEILRRQAHARGRDDAALSAIDRLERKDAVAVVTGQQVGLLGGPALTLAKALSAVAWARRLASDGIDAVPVFWMATHDHDLDEVRTVARLDATPLTLELAADGASVGRRPLGPRIDALLQAWFAAMPHAPSAALRQAIEQSHTEDASFAQAFARLLGHATAGLGLVILDPDDRAFAALARDVIARELFGPVRASAALARGRARLAALGQAEIVPTHRSLLQVHWSDEHRVRRRLRIDGDGLAAGDRRLGVAELEACLELTPERFTPAALLRPVLQDAILPSVAYVAGPTEARYLAQTDELYEWAGVPRSRVVPRGSLRWIDSSDLDRLAPAGGLATLDASAAPQTAVGRGALPPELRAVDDALEELDLQLAARRGGVDAPAEATWRAVAEHATTVATTDAAGPWAHAARCIETALAERDSAGSRPHARAHLAIRKLRAALSREGRRRDPEALAAWHRVAQTPTPSERRMSTAEVLLRGGDDLPALLLRGLGDDPSAQVTLETCAPASCTSGTEVAAPARGRWGVLALAGLGGSGRVAWDVARGLGERGHHVVLMAGGDPRWAADRDASLHHVPVPAPHVPTAANDAWLLPLADAIVATAIQHRLHALSVHYAVGLAEAAVLARDRLAARGHALRLCVTLHGSDVTVFAEHGEQRDRLRAALSSVDHITAVSAWLAAAARSKLGLARTPRVIRNAVDTAMFFPEPRGPRVSGRPAALCHASNFREIKRPLDNIDVLAKVLARGHDARLTMIGDGPLHPDARSHAQARDVAGRTTFVGPVAPAVLAGHLRSSDIVLVTSASESFSLVALEAMASGAVLVGTRCGGLEELLGNTPEWSERLLAEAGDIDGLATRVAALLADPALFTRARDAGLAIARGSFAQHEQLAAYADVLRGAP